MSDATLSLNAQPAQKTYTKSFLLINLKLPMMLFIGSSPSLNIILKVAVNPYVGLTGLKQMLIAFLKRNDFLQKLNGKNLLEESMEGYLSGEKSTVKKMEILVTKYFQLIAYLLILVVMG